MRFSKFLLLFLALTVLLASSHAAEFESLENAPEGIDVTIYYGRECGYCHKSMDFIDELSGEYPLNITKIEVWHSMENYTAFRSILEEKGYNPDLTGVPFVIIEGEIIEGYYPEQIRAAIEKCDIPDKDTCEPEEKPNTINHFLFGEIDISGMSLPLLTVVLGIADGFNPCAMWVLVYLIALLVETQDKKKIWLIVGTFVFASATLYFIFLTAWLNLFLFLGFLTPIQIIVGLIAIGTGIWHIHEHAKPGAATCAATDDKGKKKIMGQIKDLTKGAIVPATILGIILLAFTVNLIEFVCSAGIPAVFTKILTMSNLSTIEYYSYILLYVLFFMLDDIIIFGGAALTLNYVDINSKYVKYAGLFGGALLVLLGIILIFFPGMLAMI